MICILDATALVLFVLYQGILEREWSLPRFIGILALCLIIWGFAFLWFCMVEGIPKDHAEFQDRLRKRYRADNLDNAWMNGDYDPYAIKI